jgi:hypothetical protein
VTVSFIGGGNQSIQRKPPTCRKSLTNFSTCGTEANYPHKTLEPSPPRYVGFVWLSLYLLLSVLWIFFLKFVCPFSFSHYIVVSFDLRFLFDPLYLQTFLASGKSNLKISAHWINIHITSVRKTYFVLSYVFTFGVPCCDVRITSDVRFVFTSSCHVLFTLFVFVCA